MHRWHTDSPSLTVTHTINPFCWATSKRSLYLRGFSIILAINESCSFFFFFLLQGHHRIWDHSTHKRFGDGTWNKLALQSVFTHVSSHCAQNFFKHLRRHPFLCGEIIWMASFKFWKTVNIPSLSSLKEENIWLFKYFLVTAWTPGWQGCARQRPEAR